MKKIFLLMFMAALPLGIWAQYNCGDFTIQPKAGLNITNLRPANDSQKAKLGFVAGVELDYYLSSLFSLSWGLQYSQQGAKSETSIILDNQKHESKEELSCGGLNIPILANIHPVEGLTIKAGLEINFVMSPDSYSLKYTISEKDNQGNWHQTTYKETTANPYSLRTASLSIPIGLSYELSHIVFDVRYSRGITHVAKGHNFKNSVLQFTIGYKFEP